MAKDDSQALADTLASKHLKGRRSDEAAKETREAASGGDPSQKPFQALNIKLDPSLHARFKKKVQSEGRTMTFVTQRFIRHYLNDGLPPKPEG